MPLQTVYIVGAEIYIEIEQRKGKWKPSYLTYNIY